MAFFDIPGVGCINAASVLHATVITGPILYNGNRVYSFAVSVDQGDPILVMDQDIHVVETRRAALIAALCGPAAPGNSAAAKA